MEANVNEKEEGSLALLAECRWLSIYCQVNAQMHFDIAATAERQSFWLLVIPAFVAAAAGVLTAVGAFPAYGRIFGALGAASAALVGICSAFGVDRKSVAHSQAGNTMTVLRHEARALSDTFWREMSRQELSAQVHALNDRYNMLISLLPICSEKAYKNAKHILEKAVQSETTTDHVRGSGALERTLKSDSA